MAFTVPDSSPPSTPDFKSRSLASNPSTTPAGPPPSSAASFTPQGQPPPSSTFGSSRVAPRSKLSFSQSAFGQSDTFDGSESLFSSLSSSKLPPLPAQKNGSFGSSFGSQSAFGATNGSQINGFGSRGPNLSRMSEQPEEDEEDDEEYEDEEDEEEYEDEEEDGDEEEEFEGEVDGDEEDEEEDDDMEVEPTSNTTGSRFDFADVKFSAGPDYSTGASKQKMIYSNPDNAKRAKLDEKWATLSPEKPRPRPKKSSQIPSILQNLVSIQDPAEVDEPAYVIIATEERIGDMLDKVQAGDLAETMLATTLSETTSALIKLWNTAASDVNTYRPSGSIGPVSTAKGYEKATFLTSLLLPLHHPPLTDVAGGNARTSAVRAASRSLVLSGSHTRAYVPVPRVLIDWLNNNHSTLAEEVESLIMVNPNPTASADFWDVVQAGVLHGGFADMAALLRHADFNYARSALQDGLAQPGYRGAQLQNIQKLVNKVIQLLESSPLVQDDDWDVRGMEWSAYRKRIHSAILELEDFAAGQDQATLQPSSGPRFQASNFGMSQGPSAAQSGFSFTQSLRMAESHIPWSIYQSLKGIYGIILGDAEAVMAASQDWVEATIGLTAWWDGADYDDSFGQSQSHPAFDQNPQQAYVRRLAYSFALVTDDTSGDAATRPNTLNTMEVALAAVFEGNVAGLLRLLETWSLCLTSAVVEIANVGGWLNMTAGRPSLPGFLNENDLMVLSYGQNDNPALEPFSKDDVLLVYAEALFSKGPFEYRGSVTEGWELALQVLSRMEDVASIKKKVAELLEKLPVETIEQVDKIVLLCTDLGFEVEGRKTSETHGDRILNSSTHGDCDYGLAMICYARARAIRKVKDVANMLIANSLAQSRAYPPDEKLGGQLRSLIKDPKSCLSAVASADREAARILQYYASGYATLRRFYDLRDQPVLAVKEEGRTLPVLRPLARKRAAADALVAVIRSSADSIYGGLYDGERDSAVLVDGLLVLLGEALMFVDESPSTLPMLSKAQQSAILAAIEDLESVTPRVRAACEDFFHRTIDEYRREQTATTHSTSSSGFASSVAPPSFHKHPSSMSLTASTSSFSMIGSELLGSAGGGGVSGSASSGVLVARPSANEYSSPIQRGWDWRAAWSISSVGDSHEVRPSDVLRILRMRLAKATAWR